MIAERLRHVRPSMTKAMTQRAREMVAQGQSIITLSQGEPDFDTPANIRAAGMRAIHAGLTRYTPVAGIVELRRAITAKLLADHGLTYSTEQITVGCGAKQVIFNALLATLDQGSEVLIPTPCWVSYPDMVRLADGAPVFLPCDESHGFKLAAKDLERAITARTTWLILNSPNNPTGAVYARTELEAIADVLREQPHVLVLSDEIYERIAFGDACVNLAMVAPDLLDRILIVNGTSKSAAMTGWRVGFGAGPPSLVEAMNTIQGQTSSHTSSISQYAAVEAIGGDQRFSVEFNEAFLARRDFALECVRTIPGLSIVPPDGAFYLFVGCEGLIGRRTPSGNVLLTDSDVAMFLLNQAGVAVVPGEGFMMSPYLRISFAVDIATLRTAFDRIHDACATLHPQ